jgi:hypothetical protein
MVAQVFVFAKGSEGSSSATDTKPQPIDPVSSHSRPEIRCTKKSITADNIINSRMENNALMPNNLSISVDVHKHMKVCR